MSALGKWLVQLPRGHKVIQADGKMGRHPASLDGAEQGNQEQRGFVSFLEHCRRVTKAVSHLCGFVPVQDTSSANAPVRVVSAASWGACPLFCFPWDCGNASCSWRMGWRMSHPGMVTQQPSSQGHTGNQPGWCEQLLLLLVGVSSGLSSLLLGN